MYVCKHVCLHACVYACLRTCLYACMCVCMHVRMHVCLYACMHVCIFTHAYLYACMHIYVCMSVCTHSYYVRMSVYMCVYQYACMHAYMHVCMYILSRARSLSETNSRNLVEGHGVHETFDIAQPCPDNIERLHTTERPAVSRGLKSEKLVFVWRNASASRVGEDLTENKILSAQVLRVHVPSTHHAKGV